MNPTVLDILLYLFENALEDDEILPERTQLIHQLTEVGFPTNKATQAVDWLEKLAVRQQEPHAIQAQEGSFRILTAAEVIRLNTQAQGLLLHLQHIGILDSAQREVVIERLLALEDEVIDVEQVKWVVLMVLFNQPGQEAAFARMENLLYDELPNPAH